MSNKDKLPGNRPRTILTLRQKAEALFRETLDNSLEQLDSLSPETLRTALHELRVHQIELEMQNEDLQLAQGDLAVSRARYFDLYDLAPVGYITISAEGLIRETNLTAATLLGLARADLLNQPISRFIFKEDQNTYYLHRRQLFKTGAPQQFDLRVLKHDGDIAWVHLTAIAAQDETGALVCRAVLSDITGSKQAEACRAIGSDILQIFLRSDDLQTCLQRTLAALKTGTGFDAVGIRLQDGEDFPYFIQEGFPETFLLTENSLVSRTANGGACRDREGNVCLECSCGLVISGRTDPANPLFTKGGSCWTNNSSPLLGIPADKDPRYHPRNQCIHHGYASVALIPIRTRERITGLIQLNDRRKDRLTLEMVEILEGIAGHIGEALMRKKAEADREDALRRAEAAAQAKNEFLAVMSHELRTPLNGVLGCAGILADTPLDDEQKSFVQMISSSGDHLLSLVNDILDYASMERGALSIQDAPFAVADLMEFSCLTIRQSAKEKGVVLQTEIAPGVPEQVLGDMRRIRQILINLLNNAVKFTSEGSVVLRIATAVEGLRHFLDFSIEDSGIGISPETLALLFQPFTQADSKMNRAYGGSGLGLSISKRLAEAMGGSITVVSTPGKGSTFTFRLPLKVSPAVRQPACPDKPIVGTLPGAPVLVVDDLKESRELVGKLLQSLGYKAEFAENGNEAVSSFAPGKYSAVLMDMAMPGMDGLVATRRIRDIEIAAGGHMPIIALTANVLAGVRKQCLAAGMDDFLGKPFTRGELSAVLAGMARR